MRRLLTGLLIGAAVALYALYVVPTPSSALPLRVKPHWESQIYTVSVSDSTVHVTPSRGPSCVAGEAAVSARRVLYSYHGPGLWGDTPPSMRTWIAIPNIYFSADNMTEEVSDFHYDPTTDTTSGTSIVTGFIDGDTNQGWTQFNGGGLTVKLDILCSPTTGDPR